MLHTSVMNTKNIIVPTIMNIESEKRAAEKDMIFRKMAVIDLSTYPNLLNGGNIGYYQSSGRSNENLQSLYANTWLPFGGVEEDGRIIKMSDVAEGGRCNYEWVFKLLKEYYLDYCTCKDVIYTTLFTTMLTENNMNDNQCQHHNILRKYVESLNTIEDTEIALNYLTAFEELYKFITIYFLFDWQLYISSLLECGFWENKSINMHFKNFIQNKFNCIYTFNVLLPNDETWMSYRTNVMHMNKRHVTHELKKFLDQNKCNYKRRDLVYFIDECDFSISKMKNVVECIRPYIVHKKNKLLALSRINRYTIKDE